jgi:hypothetical protein
MLLQFTLGFYGLLIELIRLIYTDFFLENHKKNQYESVVSAQSVTHKIPKVRAFLSGHKKRKILSKTRV